jgi:hypothetical protein
MTDTSLETHKDFPDTFDENSLPDLDAAVLAALTLFERTTLPAFPLEMSGKLLILGSGNAGSVGRILFADINARYADESTYIGELAKANEKKSGPITSAVLISASGGKHAVSIAEALERQQIPTWLLTNNENALARTYVEASRVLVFPKNREPYTYNVSTYMGMILAHTHEDPGVIYRFITETVLKQIPDVLSQFDAFYLIIPPQYILMKDMLLTKFDELFGSRVSARVFTLEQSKHAKTVVPSEREVFISFGDENNMFGIEKNRFHIPLPDTVGYAAMMAIGYYVIGQIQKQHLPYFKDNIKEYTQKASEFFVETVPVIVE